MKNIRLFERNCNDFKYIQFKMEIESKLNIHNLVNITRHKIKSLFDINKQQEFLRYRFELLKQWIKQYEFYTRSYIEKLDSLINRLYLEDELNSFEVEYIKHYNGVIFAKERNLKNLIVEFNLKDEHEKTYYKYDHTSIFKLRQEGLDPICVDGEAYITNERIIVYKDKEIYPINFSQIINFKISQMGLRIDADNGIYFLKTDDDYINYVSLERILKLVNCHI